jgi:phosphate:Na+ symporter
MFENPLLGVLAGAVFTAIIQSSSASVGILQSLASTGAVNIGTSIPIIMGQNIGTCATALLSSIGTTRNARRASIVHLFFNLIGTIVLLVAFCVVKYVFVPDILFHNASELSIAVCHTLFNVVCTALMLPAAGLLEKLSMTLIPESAEATKEKTELLDARLMTPPAIAIERSRVVTEEMAKISAEALYLALESINDYNEELAHDIRKKEKSADKYEDVLGSYLVTLNTHTLNAKDSNESAMLLHIIGDFERISDHAVGIVSSVEELKEKNISLSASALKELAVMESAVREIMEKTVSVFIDADLELALSIEPLEETIDDLKETLRSNHIARMQKGGCSIEAGFVWSDLLNNLERVSDHCSNIAGCIVEMKHQSMDVHDYLKKFRTDDGKFAKLYESYGKKYSLK